MVFVDKTHGFPGFLPGVYLFFGGGNERKKREEHKKKEQQKRNHWKRSKKNMEANGKI